MIDRQRWPMPRKNNMSDVLGKGGLKDQIKRRKANSTVLEWQKRSGRHRIEGLGWQSHFALVPHDKKLKLTAGTEVPPPSLGLCLN
jgi:hypothetical protein